MPTVAANGQFGPDNFKVQTKSEKAALAPGTVDAKFLKDMNGNYIVDPTDPSGRPYVVPRDYDPQKTISLFKTISDVAAATGLPGLTLVALARYFPANAPGDLQRTYNGKTHAEFVEAFTPAASFNLGVATAAAKLPASVAVVGGGLYNLLAGKNPSLFYFGNNPNNPPHIYDGANLANQGAFGPISMNDDDNGNLFPARNANLFNLSTDPVGLRPINLDVLGGASGNSGLLAAGAGWAATMPADYVDRGGGDYVGPSTQVAGGTRPGNGSEAPIGALIDGIRGLGGNAPTMNLPPDLALSLPGSKAGAFVPEGEHRTDLHYTLDGVTSDPFSGTVRYDAQGNVLSMTPDNGVIVFRDANGAVSDKSFRVTTDISFDLTSPATLNPDGTWTASSWAFSSNSGVGRTVLQEAGYKDLSYTDPLVLDGGNDGVLLSPPGTGPSFDLDGDGVAETLAWPGPTDGMIVRDVNGDGRISSGHELFSVGGNGQPALASQDSNGDGKLDASDASWSQLQIWTDRNRDGYASPGELQSLADAGISSINLTPVTGSVAGQSNVKGVVATLADGSHRTLWDVAFPTAAPVATASVYYSPGIDKVTGAGQTALHAYSGLGVTIDLNGSGASQAIGGVGNDTLTGTSGDDWLIGGAGSDTFHGGAGNDLLVIDSQDLQQNIDGGSGIDTVVVADDRGVMLNLAQANVEVVYGGYGNDVFIGGGADNYFIDAAAGDDLIIGGSADDVLSGGDGNDVIAGGDGNDLIRGGRGADQLFGGNGGDVIDGGQGNDVIDGGAGNDVFIASGGDDAIDGGEGVDLLQLSGPLADYSFERLSDGGYRITDRVADRDGTETVKNVERFSSKNGAVLDFGMDAPLPVDDRVTIPAGGSVTIAAATLIANDIDFQHLTAPQLALTWVGDAVGGTVTLSADHQSVIFTPKPGFSGAMEFSYRVRDAQGNVGQTIANAFDTSVRGEMKARVLLTRSSAPSDPDFARQWYLGAVGAPQAWQEGYTGKGVKVLVLEPSGQFATARQAANLEDPDLIANKSATFHDTADHSVHATEVAGVIGAARNGIGGVGVAYGVTLDSIGFSPNPSSYDSRTDLDAISNYDVVNNSWAYKESWALLGNRGGAGELVPDAEKGAASTGRHGLGTVMVFAAGNDRARGYDANLGLLTNNEFTIAVGGINRIGDIGTSSAPVKPFSERGANILVSAPASNIVTTGVRIETADGASIGTNSAETQGTSFAAPIVSGVVALMLEANPKLSYRDVQTILAVTARKDLGDGTQSATTWSTNHDTSWNGVGMHFSTDFGFGMVDAAAAIRVAKTWVSEGNSADRNWLATAVEAAPADRVGTAPGARILNMTVDPAQLHQQLNIEQVVLHLTLDHPRWSDLVVTLVSPSGTRSVLLDRPGAAGNLANPGATTLDVDLMSVAFRGEAVAGTWQLIVEDDVQGQAGTGTVTAKLNVVGTSADQIKHYVLTDEYAGGRTVNPVAGPSELNAAAVSGPVQINLSAGTGNINGKALTIAPGIDRLVGSDWNDVLIGSDADETILGGAGDDIIQGGGGNDRLEGGGGNDVIDGGAGADILVGGAGAILTGGSGKDAFIIDGDQPGTTTITDFQPGADKLFVRTADRIAFGGVTQTVLPDGSLKLSYQVAGGTRNVILQGLGAPIAEAQWHWIATTQTSSYAPALDQWFDKNPVSVAPHATLTPLFHTYSCYLIRGSYSINVEVSQSSVRITDGTLVGSLTPADCGAVPPENIYGYKLDHVTWTPGTEADDIMLPGPVTKPDGVDAQEWEQAIAHPQYLGFGGNDEIHGDARSEFFNGGIGDDAIFAGAGDDTLIGGDGNDYLDGGDGNDNLDGGAGDDVLIGGAGWDILKGGDGNDVLTGNGQLFGGAGDDVLTGTGLLSGDAGNDRLTVTAGGSATLSGGAGSDTFVFAGGFGASSITDLEPGDLVRFASSANATVSATFAALDSDSFSAVLTFHAGDGGTVTFSRPLTFSVDTLLTADIDLMPGNIQYDDGGHVAFIETGREATEAGDVIVAEKYGSANINALGGDDAIFARTVNHLNIDAGSGNDTVYALEGMNHIDGGSGDDRIRILTTTASAIGSDTLIGGAGNDTIWAGSHGATVYGDDVAGQVSGDDTIYGGAGNDFLYGGGGNDTLIGNGGTDLLDGGAGDDVLTGNGTLIGGDGNDKLTGNGTLDGGAGNDILAGNGTLHGGAGNDTLTGNGFLYGDAGDDTLTGSGTLDGGDGNDKLVGGSGADILLGGAGDDQLAAGAGDDTLYGGSGNDILSGGAGNNVLYGDSGDDVLSAGDGNDSLYGGDGDDVLVGGGGTNIYSGGAGDDTIVARGGTNTILVDAASGNDTIWALGANDVIKFTGVNPSSVQFDLHHGVNGTIRWGTNSITLKDFSDDAKLQFDYNGQIQSFRLSSVEPNDGVRPGDFDFVTVYDPTVEGDPTKIGKYVGTDSNDQLYGGPKLSTDPAYWWVIGRDGNDRLAAKLLDQPGGTSGGVLDGGAGDDLLLAGNGVEIVRGSDHNMGSDTLEMPKGITPEMLVVTRIPNPLLSYDPGLPGQHGGYGGDAFPTSGVIKLILKSYGYDLGLDFAFNQLYLDAPQYDTLRIQTRDGKLTTDIVGYFSQGDHRNNVADVLFPSILDDSGNPLRVSLGQIISNNSRVSRLDGLELRTQSWNWNWQGGFYRTDVFFRSEVPYPTFGADPSESMEIGTEGDDHLTGIVRGEFGVNSASWYRDYIRWFGGKAFGLPEVILGFGGNDTIDAGGAFFDDGQSRDTRTVHQYSYYDDVLQGLIDTVNGGDGDDTYVYHKGDGALWIAAIPGLTSNGAAGIDTLRLVGYTAADLSQDFHFGGVGHLVIGQGADATDIWIDWGSNNDLQVDYIKLDDKTLSVRALMAPYYETNVTENSISYAPYATAEGVHELIDAPEPAGYQQPARDLRTNIDPSRIVSASDDTSAFAVPDNSVVVGTEMPDTYSVDPSVVNFAVIWWDRGDNLSLYANYSVSQGYLRPPSDGHMYSMSDWVALSSENDLATDAMVTWTTEDAPTVEHHLVLADVFGEWNGALRSEYSFWSAPNPTVDPNSAMVVGTMGNDYLFNQGYSLAFYPDGISNLGSVIYGRGGDDVLVGDQFYLDWYGNTPPPKFAASNDQLYGGSGNDRLYGGGGNDLLDGGTGVDLLYGGPGDDLYILRAQDIEPGQDITKEVVELPGEGNDTVQADFNLDLRQFANVENGTLSGDQPLHLTGNEGNNRLEGNGTGCTLIGLAGDDTYVVKGPEIVIEAAGEGHDTIQSAINVLQLPDNVEDLVSIGTGLQLTGNGLDNRITGDAGNNLITGATGNDVLAGGGGSDTYMFHAGDGQDTIVNGPNDISTEATPSGKLILQNVGLAQLWFAKAGDDLVIKVIGTTDQIVVTGWYTAPARQLAEIVGNDGAVKNVSNAVDNLVLAMAAYQSAHSEFNVAAAVEMPNDQPSSSALRAAMHVPSAINDVVTSAADTPASIAIGTLLANDADADGGRAMSLASISPVSAKGAAVSLHDGHIVYDPGTLFRILAAGQSITDTFTYTVSDDASGGTGSATVTMTVLGVNDAPTACDDTATTTEDTIADLSVASLLANDTDPDAGDAKTVVSVAAVSSRGAAVSLQNGHVHYDPGALFQNLGAGQTATDSFTYTMSDAAGATSTATVTMTVGGVNGAPVAHDDTGTTSEDNAVTLTAASLLANDTDVDTGDTKSLVSVSAISAKGAAVSIRNGNVVYDPRAAAVLQSLIVGEATTDTFSYTIRDAAGATSTATVTMTITGAYDGATPNGVFRIGTEFVANTETDGYQSAPKVTGLANGGFVVTWVDGNPTAGDVSGTSIKAQLLGANGDKTGPEFLVNTQAANAQLAPAVAALAGGGFIVTWEDNSGTLGDASGSSVKAQLFDTNGGKIGSEFLVDTVTLHDQKAPAVAALPNGGFVINWQDFSAGVNNGTSYGIKAQVFAADGTKQGSEIVAAAQPANYRYSSGIMGLSNGNFIVTWEDASHGDGSLTNIKARIFGPTGTAVTGEFVVNQQTAGFQNIPVVALANGGFVVAWEDGSQLGGDSSFDSIKGQIFDVNGNKIGDEFLVNTQTLNNQGSPSIVALTGGGFVVSWRDSSGTLGDSDGTSVKAQVFNGNGAKVGSEFLVNTQTLGDQYAPAAAGLANGGFVVAWERDDGVVWGVDDGGQAINSDVNIRAQVFGLSLPRTINGTSGDDTLVGGIGPDALVGNGGNDTYRFDAIQKSEIIVNGIAGSTAPSGTLQLTAAALNNLWFDHVGNDLVLDVLGTTQKVTIQNWYGNSGAQLGSIQAENYSIANNQVDTLVQAMTTFEASYAASHGGVAFNPATAGATITDTALAAAVNNTWQRAA